MFQTLASLEKLATNDVVHYEEKPSLLVNAEHSLGRDS